MVQISTAFMIFFSIFGLFFYPHNNLIADLIYQFVFDCDMFSGKFGAFFASIPLPIFAAIYCVLLGIVG